MTVTGVCIACDDPGCKQGCSGSVFIINQIMDFTTGPTFPAGTTLLLALAVSITLSKNQVICARCTFDYIVTLRDDRACSGPVIISTTLN